MNGKTMPTDLKKDLPLCIQCKQCGGTVALRLTLDEQVCQYCQAKNPFSDSTLQAIQRARQKLRKRSRAEQNIQSTIGGRDSTHEFYTVILVTPLWLMQPPQVNMVLWKCFLTMVRMSMRVAKMAARPCTQRPCSPDMVN